MEFTVPSRKVFPVLLYSLLIFAVGFSMRLIYLNQLAKNYPTYALPQNDANYYHEWALNMSQGKPTFRDQSFFFLSPGYSFALSAIYKYLGSGVKLVSIVQFIIGSFSCLFVYLIARSLAGNSAGLIAGLLVALFPASCFYEGFLLSISWITFFNLLGLYFIAIRGSSNIGLVMAGLAWGLSYQFRPNIVILVLFGCLWLYGQQLRNGEPGTFSFSEYLSFSPAKFVPIFLFLTGFILLMGVRMLFSYHVTGNLNPATRTMGINLFIGNNPSSLGTSDFINAFGKRIYSATMYQDVKDAAEFDLGRELNAGEVDSYYFKKAVAYVLSNPAAWVRLSARKAILFFKNEEIPSNYSFELVSDFVSILKNNPLNFSLIGAIGLIGMIFYSSWSRHLILILYIFSYFLSCIIFFVAGEYRYPVTPVLIIFASIAISQIFGRALTKQFSKKYFASIVLAVILWAWMGSSDKSAAEQSQFHYYKGVNFLTARQYDKAIEEYRKSVEIEPSELAFSGLARASCEIGHYEEALNSYKQAAKYGLPAGHYHINAGGIYMSMKKPQQAIEHYKNALKENLTLPEKRVACFNLGAAYYEGGHLSPAVAAFERYMELEIDPAKLDYAKKLLEKIKGDRNRR